MRSIELWCAIAHRRISRLRRGLSTAPRQVIYEFPMLGQPLRVLRGNNLHAQLDAFVANESVSSGDQLQHFRPGPSAERTGRVGHLRPSSVIWMASSLRAAIRASISSG